jgi:C1A family cysteine protease
MKIVYPFHCGPILPKVSTGLFVFFFFLITAGVWECSGELILSANRDWTADIAITFSPESGGQGDEIYQKINQVLQREVQPHRVAYRVTQHLEGNADHTYKITLQGNEGLGQFQRVIFFAADPTIPLSDGPVALELTGKVKMGESLPITLESNPSTGYYWELVQADPSLVFQVGESVFQPKSDLLGASLTQTIYLEGVEEGVASLQFTYSRPWAKNDPPKRRTTIQVPDMAMIADLSNPHPPLMRSADPLSSAPDGEIPSLSAQMPASFDWRSLNGHNYVSPVKNQGNCGSCWAFGTVGPMEAQFLISGAGPADLSEQYLVSCNNNGWSCSGGWWAHDYHISRKVSGELEAGSVLESVFPYTAGNSLCNAPHGHYQKLARWNYVGGSNSVPSVDAIKNAIATYGPLAVAVCVGSSFSGYRSGIFVTDEKSACSGGVNHAVVLVGWDDVTDSWIMKNSWGTNWGESGYMRIKRGISNIGYAANFVVYEYSPPPPPPQFTAKYWIYLPVVLKSFCGENVCNGDFEVVPNISWVEYSSNGWGLISNLSEYGGVNNSGSYSAWLGGDDSEISVLSQQITVPANALTLSFWYWIISDDDCGFDSAAVTLGASTLRTYDLCASLNTDGWVKETVDITAYRGQTLTLVFKAETDEMISSSFILDDVVLTTTTGQQTDF